MDNFELTPVLVGNELWKRLADAHGASSAESMLRALRKKSLIRQLRDEARLWDFVRGNTRSPA